MSTQAADARSQAHHPRAICDPPRERHVLELPPTDGSARARFRALRWSEGLWRDTENGKPVDATGNVVQTDIDGAFDGEPSSRQAEPSTQVESAWSSSASASAWASRVRRRPVHAHRPQQRFRLHEGRLQGAAGRPHPDRPFLYRTNEQGVHREALSLNRGPSCGVRAGIAIGLPVLEVMTPVQGRGRRGNQADRLLLLAQRYQAITSLSSAHSRPEPTSCWAPRRRHSNPAKELLIVSGVNMESAKKEPEGDTAFGRHVAHAHRDPVGRSRCRVRRSPAAINSRRGRYAGGISVDQYIAKKVETPTRFPSTRVRRDQHQRLRRPSLQPHDLGRQEPTDPRPG